VNNDSQNIQSATSAVSQASQAVDQARQTATDAINQAAAQQANEAQNKIDQLESQGKAQASQNLDNQINNVSGQVTDAQNDVNNTNSKISDLQGQVKDLQDQEKNTQTDPNIKTVPNGVIDTSKSLLENVARGNLWEPIDLSKENGNIVAQNIYVSPDNDKGATNPYANIGADSSLPAYDPYYASNFDVINSNTGATDAQKQELAILMMNEINHAREQRGLKPFTMTEQKYNQAQVRASQHSAQILSHDDNDIKTAFGRDQYECLAYIPVQGTGNLLSMYYQAGATLSSMLNADASSDWGHRENFLEDTGSENYDAAFGFHLTDDGQYYVLTFDYDGPARNNTPNMMDRIAQYQAMGPITGDAKTVDNSAKINDLNNQITNLQNTLTGQTSKLQSLQSQLQNLQAQKANVQFDLNQLSSDQQTEYNNAKETLATVNDWKQGQLSNLDSNSNVQDALNKLSSAKNNLESAKQTQSEDEVKLQQAKDGLASLNQVLATKKSALSNTEQTANASANQAVKDAQAKLNTINGKIAELQNAIEATKTTISNAQAQLDKDNQKITDIKNNQKPAKPDPGKDEGNKGTTTPTDPSKDDNKGSETTNPTNPVKPDDGKKDDNKGTTTPSNPSEGDDQKNHQTTPVEPSKPSDDNKGNVTPTDPNKDNKSSETTNPTTPSNPTTPAQPDTGNASISGQAGHKPATSDNGSEVSDNTTTKPTIVLPTTDKENGSAVSDAQGQNTTMTREQYKAQQAKLPQTGNDDSKAVIALGVLAGMFGFGLVTKGKKEF
ncbi:SEC10/PgrA surface exclusion domain-containing protein, partial [Limosilactobacillus balticus]|uniref:SEC10/PgrA surface exclusion domain-containing protein n=1 Tax=Limosilactobacillus balticus TaxID=2759747 RepID=UPI003990EAEE